MRDEYQHFLITRMHVRIHEDLPLPEAGWLEPRLEMFEKVLAPTVLAQSDQLFDWLVCVDVGSPKWLAEYVERVTKGRASVAVFDTICERESISREIVARSNSTKWLITSRVDTDDALALDYIEAVHQAFRQEREFINFPDGVQVWRGVVLEYSYYSNAFISMSEPAGEHLPFTVFGDWHNRLSNYAPVRQVRGAGPMWLQSVHGGNAVNAARGFPTNRVDMRGRFGEAVANRVLHLSPANLARHRVAFVIRTLVRTIQHPRRAISAARAIFTRMTAQ